MNKQNDLEKTRIFQEFRNRQYIILYKMFRIRDRQLDILSRKKWGAAEVAEFDRLEVECKRLRVEYDLLKDDFKLIKAKYGKLTPKEKAKFNTSANNMEANI